MYLNVHYKKSVKFNFTVIFTTKTAKNIAASSFCHNFDGFLTWYKAFTALSLKLYTWYKANFSSCTKYCKVRTENFQSEDHFPSKQVSDKHLFTHF